MNGSECRLCHLHVDERGDSVTLGFDTGLPSSSERLEFHLLFTGVEGLHVSGWTASDARELSIAPVPTGGCSVSLGPRGSGLRFHAAAVEVAHTRTYLAYADETRSADSRQK